MAHDGFPPRGTGEAGAHETPADARWIHPYQLDGDWDFRPGQIVLGRAGQRVIGYSDNRHLATLAGARGGKTSTVLMHTAATWPGSMIVTDPKGEIARIMAPVREAMGQKVYVMDPFGEVVSDSAAYNPLSELGFGRAENIPPDAAMQAESMIVDQGSDLHWPQSARNFVRGEVLRQAEIGTPTIRALRRAMHRTRKDMEEAFAAMAASEAFDGIVANIGSAFLAKLEDGGRELASIMSTAQEQTTSLDDVLRVTDRSDFRMRDLRDGGITIFLVLPGMRIATHHRWLRLMVQAALGALERFPVPAGKPPVLFMLEEFAALGQMRSIEAAAGLMAGYGVKLWPVLQDLSQLKTHYPKSWETFIGNAGLIQAFANIDLGTTELLSRMLGMTRVIERQTVRVSSASLAGGDDGVREQVKGVRLIEPDEIARHFARETNRQLIIIPGMRPLYLERMPPYGKRDHVDQDFRLPADTEYL